MLLVHLEFGNDGRIAVIDVTGDLERMRVAEITIA